MNALKEKIASRRSGAPTVENGVTKLFFVHRYSRAFASLGLRKLLRKHLKRLKRILPTETKHVADFDIVIAHRAGVSAFLALYSLSAPWSRVGRAGLF